MRRTGPLLRRALFVLALPALLVAIWWVVSDGSASVYSPPLSTILDSFQRVWTGRRLADDVLPSLLRLAGGYAGAAVAGVALGVLIGSYRRVRAAAEPVLEFLRAVPPPVLVPVIMLFAGIGDTHEDRGDRRRMRLAHPAQHRGGQSVPSTP